MEKFKLIKREQENELIVSFYFKKENEMPLERHKAGQFIAIKPIKEGQYKDEIRQYSLSMKPGEAFYRISVKKEDKGIVSKYLHENLNVGDVIEGTDPLGEFILKDSKRPLVLLSGGIGVTPMMSMLYEGDKTDRKIIFGQAVLNSSVHTFKKELEDLKENNKNIQSAIFYQTPLENDVKGVDYDEEVILT